MKVEYALFELGENAQPFPYLSSSMGLEGLLINFSPPAPKLMSNLVFIDMASAQLPL
jgi:hypothetical protein